MCAKPTEESKSGSQTTSWKAFAVCRQEMMHHLREVGGFRCILELGSIVYVCEELDGDDGKERT